MTRTTLILLAAGGSAALLIGAFGFQMLGYAPCQMCLWQRWPHGAAVVIGLAAAALPWAILPLLGALAAAVTGAIGVFHTGVERGWWEGITTCAGAGDLSGMSAADLLDTSRDLGPPLVRCDVVAWQFLGLSMASWNAVLSFALVLLWLSAWRKSRS